MALFTSWANLLCLSASPLLQNNHKITNCSTSPSPGCTTFSPLFYGLSFFPPWLQLLGNHWLSMRAMQLTNYNPHKIWALQVVSAFVGLTRMDIKTHTGLIFVWKYVTAGSCCPVSLLNTVNKHTFGLQNESLSKQNSKSKPL